MKPPARQLLAIAALTAMATAATAQQCPAPPPVDDSTALQVPERDTESADAPIEIRSAGAEVTRQGDVTLLGEVTVRQGKRLLTAGTATYEAATQSFAIEGSVEYSDPDVRISGATGNWSGQRGGVFNDTRFELPARPARGSASQLRLSPQGDLGLKDVLFTTCPVGNDDWLLKAGSIDIDREAQLGTGREVRLEFKGIPLLYTPWISFPAGVSRKSGFLFPTFGTSSSGGFETGIPYYFNLAPNYDATLEPTLLTRRGLRLGGQFRYLGAASRGRLDGSILPSDRVSGGDRAYGRWQHLTDLSESLRFDASLEDVSDDQYFEDFGRGPGGTSVLFLERRLRFEYLGSGWRARGLAQNFRTIDQTIDPFDRPYARAPQLLLNGSWPLTRSGLEAGFSGEAVNFYREDSVTGVRLDLTPTLAWPLRRPGAFLVPSASYRHTAYQLDNAATGQQRSPTRGAPMVAVDAGLIFEREAAANGRLLQTLEPRVLYSWVPFRNQDGLPVFDSGQPELDLIQLFRTNRFVGADRLADVNQLAVGVTTRLVETASGRQYLSATIGQQYFLERSRVTLPGELPETRSASDLVAELELAAYRNWSVELAMQYDPQASNTVLGQTFVQYRPRPDSLVNLGYRYREGRVEQWETSAAWRVGQAWSLYGRYVYSARDQQSIDAFAGVEYESCCWRLRVVASRYLSNRTGEQDTSVSLQLELKGLSSVGTTNSAFLEQGIRGYSRDRAALP